MSSHASNQRQQKPLKPRPHQRAAVEAAVAGLRKNKRGQVIMACGTGKTLVGPLVADRLQARTVLVFVPSLLLARQLLNDYRRQWPTAAYVAVCSDIDRVASEDAPDAGDLGCVSTTDPATAAKFLRGRGRRVVIATYQSARVLVGLKFDGAVFDEAHRTAGAQGKPFAVGLHDENIRCGWRLFMTATPRHAEIVSEKGATREVYSMDDPAVFGPELYKLSLREAVDRKLIVDYRVAVSVFNTRRRPGVTAQQIAVRRAMSRYDTKKVFTFHSTVAAAENFVGAARSLRNVVLLHVNGTQVNADRREALEGFAASKQGIVSNCRCLTEGVDLPSCDMVVFMDPKKSAVEIVQAIGRALRVSSGKKRAIIFLPIFVNEKSGEKVEDAIRRTKFDKLHDVLQALQEHDEALAAELVKSSGSSTFKRLYVDNALEDVSHAVATNIRKYVTVRMLQPFVGSTSTHTKERLLRMAQAGLARPQQKTGTLIERRLGTAFSCFVTKAHKQYDAAFTDRVRQASPVWLMNTSTLRVQRNMQDILALAKSGVSRPSRSDPRARHICTYLHRYPDFRKEVLAVAPSWDPATYKHKKRGPRPQTRRMKEALLARAARGEDRPQQDVLQRMRNYMIPGGKVYDPVFTKKIRELAPLWFIRRRHDRNARSTVLEKLVGEKVRLQQPITVSWGGVTHKRTVGSVLVVGAFDERRGSFRLDDGIKFRRVRRDAFQFVSAKARAAWKDAYARKILLSRRKDTQRSC